MTLRKHLAPVVLSSINPELWKNYKQTIEIANKPQKDILNIQREKLKSLLLHSYNNVPYYKKILGNSGVIRKNKVLLDNYTNIPILTKDIIRKNIDTLISIDAPGRKFYKNHTGGSTGEPLTFFQDKHYENWNFANKLFYAHLHGKEPGEKEIKLWGSDKDIIENTIGLKNKLKFFIFNRSFINSFKFSEKDIKDSIVKINLIKPKLLWSYVNSLESLSDYVVDNKIQLYNPEIIFSAAGTLYPKVRQKIEKAFPNSKIINVYGSREMGDMAIEEEPNKGLILFEHTHYFEFINYKKSEKICKLIVSSLENYSMPLIRYDIGDLTDGLAKESGVFTNFRKIKNIIGRETSLIKIKDGGSVPPEFFIHMIGVYYNKGDIKKFQVIQEGYKNITIKYVASKNLNQKIRDDINNSIKQVMGNKIVVNYKKTVKISESKSGKYLYVISKI